jgi:hypothetical protein
MRRTIIILVCSVLTLGLIASCIVIAATLSLASALANGLAGAFDWAIPEIAAVVFAVVIGVVIPVLVAVALMLFAADQVAFIALLWGLLKLLGLQ